MLTTKLKITLTVLAVVLAAINGVTLTWSAMRAIGGMPGSEGVVAWLLILLIFPTILIVSIYKCTYIDTLWWIWGVTIVIYFALPVKESIREGNLYMERQAGYSFREMLRDDGTSWRQIRRMIPKMGYPERGVLNEILLSGRLDIAECFFKENPNPSLSYTNIAEYMAKVSRRPTTYNGSYIDSISVETASAVGFMLDNGWDVDAVTEYNKTALHHAISNGDRRTANLLIERGINVNAKTERGNTPLWTAAYRGDTQRVKLLIDHGADINAVDTENESALYRAAESGNLHIVEMLLSHGADPNILPYEKSWSSIVDRKTNPQMWDLLVRYGMKQL